MFLTRILNKNHCVTRLLNTQVLLYSTTAKKKDWRNKKWFTYDDDDDQHDSLKENQQQQPQKISILNKSESLINDFREKKEPLDSPSLKLDENFDIIKETTIYSHDNVSIKEEQDDDDDDINIQINQLEQERQEEKSKYRIGTEYEYLCISIFNSFGMKLKRSGGSNDKGVDFIGEWKPSTIKYNIIGQCKKYSKKVGPNVIREFDSTLSRYIENQEKQSKSKILKSNHQCIGIITSHSGFTATNKSLIEDYQHPIILCHIVDQGILSFHMNLIARNLLPNLIIARKSISPYDHSTNTLQQQEEQQKKPQSTSTKQLPFYLELLYLNKDNT
ncbi:hypothetical protein CYY_001585 [Polysphondylium violaceum]|uniref:Restriction endonuclease type IV Mrr domain-containing protein n=1 Tax=Polysphondylium violaceum TaxID=133409 RepID=A0A8J4PZM6_9MYCE|nr:hypothetical protein CYY_001585 [Polysphondylium violaceum]